MNRSIAIVRYNAGNIRSVLCALRRLGYDGVVSDDPAILARASRVIFPGVGEASTAMRHIINNNLHETIVSLHQPFLGICLGMQLMCSHSDEQNTDCMGIFDMSVVKFPKGNVKIPHMGWNTLQDMQLPLATENQIEPWCYFVHSYYVPVGIQTIASCTYGSTQFSAALGKDNFFGFQFHPEKSGKFGATLLRRFIEDDWVGGF